jgi:hypothetical protein
VNKRHKDIIFITGNTFKRGQTYKEKTAVQDFFIKLPKMTSVDTRLQKYLTSVASAEKTDAKGTERT